MQEFMAVTILALVAGLAGAASKHAPDNTYTECYDDGTCPESDWEYSYSTDSLNKDSADLFVDSSNSNNKYSSSSSSVNSNTNVNTNQNYRSDSATNTGNYNYLYNNYGEVNEVVPGNDRKNRYIDGYQETTDVNEDRSGIRNGYGYGKGKGRKEQDGDYNSRRRGILGNIIRLPGDLVEVIADRID